MMKLHLPLSLLHALLCVCCTFSVGTATFVGGALALAPSVVMAATPYVNSGNSLVASATVSGGVLQSTAADDLALDGYSSVTLNSNTIYADGYSVYGGVIYHYNALRDSVKQLSINHNAVVTFDGNTISSSASGTGLGNYGGSVFGGVLYNGSMNADNVEAYADIMNNGVVTFANNAAYGVNTMEGGAIYEGGESGTRRLRLSENEKLLFDANSLTVSGGDASGGALYSRDAVEICGNGSLAFSGNYLVDATGKRQDPQRQYHRERHAGEGHEHQAAR